ncbi:MAG: hypothetical protein K8L91_21515 [Anaerolineae bacterium]|nr:hypothetical protein [Anaerolineae bacterium]
MHTEPRNEPITLQLAKLLNDIGRLVDAYFYDGQLDTAMQVFEASAHLLDLAETRRQDALGFLLHYGKLAAQHGRHTRIGFSKAFQITQQAMTLADNASIAAALDLTGLVHYYEALDADPADFSTANEFFQRALQLIETTSEVPTKTRFDVLFHVGLVYQMNEALAEAGQFFERAYNLALANGLRYEQAGAARHRGYVAYAANDFEGARRYYAEVVAIHDEIGFRAFQPYSLIALGELHRELGETNAARIAIERAAEMARPMGVQRVVESADAALAQLEQATSV